MTLFYPIWLLLALPWVVAMGLWRMPTRLLRVIRGLAVAAVLLGLAGLAIEWPSRAGTVVVVSDRSFSMPPGAAQRQLEIIHALEKEMSGGDRLAVVSFGRRVAIEQAPQTGKFNEFTHVVGRDGSNLAGALDTALSLIPAGAPGRILLVSDGRYTGPDPVPRAAGAATRDIAIDHFALQRPLAGDLAIDRLDTPTGITPGEAFMIWADVRSPIAQTISYQLTRNGALIASGSRHVPAGLSRMSFRDRADEPGTAQYNLQISAPEEDPLPENNRARMLTAIAGPKPLLVVSPTRQSAFAALLAKGRLNIRAITADQADFSLESLAGYSGVCLEDVPAQAIGAPAMENLAAWVRHTGSGFMMTGGESSFGPGGYFKSPLEPIMPVSMELRREHRKLSVAIVVALDRSGSMSMVVPGGRTKMDLANAGAAQVVEMLSAFDEVGVWAVDSQPHKIVELGPLTNKPQVTSKIRSIASQGGGIYVYEALKASVGMVTKAQAETKHIILFSDANDSEQPGQYIDLLDKASKAGITVSVIGLGKPTDSDAAFLRDVAKRGNGRIFFTENPAELPRLFAQDTIVVARSAFIDDPVSVRTTGSITALSGSRFADPPGIGGYNLCYLRPGATLAARSVDEYEAPILASWQVGTGRALAYTGQVDGPHTGRIAGWPLVGDFFTTLARWTAGRSDPLGPDMLATQTLQGSTALVELHLDPNREGDPFGALPTATVLRGRLGQPPQSMEVPLQWTGPDTLATEVELTGDQTAIATVNVDNHTAPLPPVCLPYSPEYRPVSHDRGAPTLEALAAATAGLPRDAVTHIWRDIPRTPQLLDLRPYLLFIALGLLLAEVLERRSGLLSTGRLMRRAPAEARQAAAKAPRPARQRIRFRKPKPEGDSLEPSAEPPTDAPTPAEPDKPAPSMLDAMKRAQHRATGRTRRRD